MALRALLQYLIAVVEVNICILIKPWILHNLSKTCPNRRDISWQLRATPTGFIRLGSYEPVPYVKFTCSESSTRILNYGEQRELGCDDVNWPKVGHREFRMEPAFAVEEFWRRATPRVLIVSVGVAQAQSVRTAVQSAGYSIGGVAADVPSALKAMSRQRFDAVIVGDPDLYCLELARSTLVQGIPFAVLEPCQFERPRSPPQKSARAKVMH